jgi:hypothetical protein
MAGRTTRDVTSARDLPNIEWRKSRYSDDQGDNCVEVALMDGRVLVRDSKDPHGPTLAFTPGEWRAFVDGVKDSEFDLD